VLLTVRDALDLGRLPDTFVGLKAALGVDEVRGEKSVDQCALPETRLACP
jgi:hypothetical protein